jgi:hypothetical protein
MGGAPRRWAPGPDALLPPSAGLGVSSRTRPPSLRPGRRPPAARPHAGRARAPAPRSAPQPHARAHCLRLISSSSPTWRRLRRPRLTPAQGARRCPVRPTSQSVLAGAWRPIAGAASRRSATKFLRGPGRWIPALPGPAAWFHSRHGPRVAHLCHRTINTVQTFASSGPNASAILGVSLRSPSSPPRQPLRQAWLLFDATGSYRPRSVRARDALALLPAAGTHPEVDPHRAQLPSVVT